MRILIIEDDELLADALQAGLRQAGFAPDRVADGVAANHALASEPYAAAVLDLGLPRRDGLDVLRRAREGGKRLPVLILTARDTVPDRISGLDAGADDYLVKPFDMGELAARLRALIRRAGGLAEPLIRLGELEIDPAGRGATWRGEPVELSGREFALLEALALSAGKVLSRRQLEERLYAWGEEAGSNTIEVYIHHLRRKFGPDLIRTIRGVGYLLPRPADRP